MNSSPKALLAALALVLPLSSVAPAQMTCSSRMQANYDSPLLTNYWEFQDVWKRCYLVQNTHPYPIEICQAAQRLSHNLGLLPILDDPSVFFSWARALPFGNNFLPHIATGAITPAVTIPFSQTPSVCRSTFIVPMVLQPGERIFLVANYYIPPLTVGGNWISSPLTHGNTDVKSWYWKNGHWNHSLPSGYHYELVYRPYVDATTANLSGACGGDAGPLSLSCSVPFLGDSVSMTLSNLRSGDLSTFALGFSDPNASLTALGAPGCKLRTTTDIFFPAIASPMGDIQQSLAMPEDLSVLGARFFVQGLSFDATANQLGMSFSAGVRATVGSY